MRTGFLRFFQPGILFHVLVAEPLWSTVGAARLEVARPAIDGGDVKTRVTTNNVLLDARAVGGGVVFLFVYPAHRRVNKTNAVSFHGALVQAQKKLDLVVDANVKRVLLEGALPVRHHAACRSECHSLSLVDGVCPRNVHRLPGNTTHFIRCNFATRSESPGASEQYAHAKAEALVARNVLHLLFASRNVLGAIAIDPDVGIGGA